VGGAAVLPWVARRCCRGVARRGRRQRRLGTRMGLPGARIRIPAPWCATRRPRTGNQGAQRAQRHRLARSWSV